MSLARWSVRAQLGLLMAAILVPVFVAMAVYLVKERQQARDRAYAQVKAVADQAALNLQSFLDRNEGALQRLAERPLVKQSITKGSTGQCEPLLTEYASVHPEFTNLVVRDPRGEVLCSASGVVPQAAAFKGTGWFDQALQSDRFRVGDAFFGALSGRWLAMLSQPVRSNTGQVSGFVMVPVDLQQLSPFILGAVPAQVQVTVQDRERRIVLRSSEPQTYIGKPSPSGLLARTPDQGNGRLVVADALGVRRLWAFTELPGTGWRVAAGVREDEAFAQSDRALVNGTLAGLALLVLSWFMAWWLSLRIVRPIEALSTVAARVASGDDSARVDLGRAPKDIETVMQVFNHMLDVRGQAQALLDEREQRLQFLLSRTSAAIFTSRASGDFAMTFVSDSVQNLLGYSPAEFLSEPNFWSAHLHPDDVERFKELRGSFLEEGLLNFEYRFLHKDGQYRWLRDEIRLFRDAQGEPVEVIGFLVDITRSHLAQKQAAEEIHALAYFDALTELPNRRMLTEQLKKALATHARSGRHAALLFIDLDHFKTLNDTLGHGVGDMLLQQVARRLVACVRESDTVARLGGDEFLVILEELGDDAHRAAALAESVGRKILAALNEPYTLVDREHRSTPSIGITLFGQPGQLADELLKQADLAMYQSKAGGRNTLRFFDARMQADMSERVAMEADLRDSLVHQELFLHFQPVVRGDGAITGAEALVRWKHPRRGLVGPGEFIPLAEVTGLILPLGQWVMQAACAQLAAWGTNPATAQLSLAVNVSTLQFLEPDFVDQVMAVLAATGAPPQLLKLELTESLLANNLDAIVAKMSALQVQGVRFSLDDFGTGYSSLSYLKRLPLYQLKIDQSFVRDVLIDPNDAAIARTIISLGDSLGLAVLAEGVETEGQRQFLADSGCHSYQGYLFSRPLPIAEFDLLVAARA